MLSFVRVFAKQTQREIEREKVILPRVELSLELALNYPQLLRQIQKILKNSSECLVTLAVCNLFT